MVSPGASALNAMWPGPRAVIMISGIPAFFRFHGLAIRMASSRTRGSVCSSTWWEK